MTFWTPTLYNQSINLQSTLASSTSDNSLVGEIKGMHHPITCSTGDLYLDEDNTMRCDHSTAPPENPRNQAVIDTAVVFLIFEEAYKRFK